MRAIKVDSNRNPIIEHGAFVWVFDIDVIKQNCDQAMRQQLGELIYAKDKGIEYINNVFTGNPNYQLFAAQARTQLLAVDGVTSVKSFSYEISNDTLNYTAEINTIFGETTVTSY